jgi:hypothetical protein
MHANPCWTWLNSNSTVRAAGDKRAAELSATYPKILSNHKFKNFDLVLIATIERVELMLLRFIIRSLSRRLQKFGLPAEVKTGNLLSPSMAFTLTKL